MRRRGRKSGRNNGRTKRLRWIMSVWNRSDKVVGRGREERRDGIVQVKKEKTSDHDQMVKMERREGGN